MSNKLFTFHKIVAGCEEGSREAWEAFLADYTPIVFQLSDVYFGFSPQKQNDFWRDALVQLSTSNFETLKRFEHQAEREFLTDLRDFLLEQGAEKLDPALDSTETPRPTPEAVLGLLKGLPLLDQEVLFFKLCGYSDATIEKILVTTPAVARKGLERLRAEYSPLLAGSDDRCVWPAAWAVVLRTARKAKTEGCPPLRHFVRIHEGGFQWHEKEPAEEHVTGCLHCLSRWTALREIWHWRKQAKPRPADEIDALLSALPLRTETKARKTLFKRMFG